MSVGIVGGGLLGLGIAHQLAQSGVEVELYEADKRLGGLAGSTKIGGVAVDRYYHAVTTTDDKVVALAEYARAEHPLASARRGLLPRRRRALDVDAQGGPDLPGPADRRQGAARRVRARLRPDQGPHGARRDPRSRRGPASSAATGSGNACGRRCWTPSSTAATTTSRATYLWSRMRRTAGTRSKGGREVMGAIEGGYQALVDRLAERIRALGGTVHTSTPVRHIPVVGLRPRAGRGHRPGPARARHRRDDAAAPEPARASSRRELEDALGPDPLRYMGIVCLVARVKRSVSPYYAINITDRRVPITSVVETTHVVDPEWVDGHLIYVPRYVQSDEPGARSHERGHHRGVPRPCADALPGLPPGGRDREPGGARPRRGAGPRGRRRQPHPARLRGPRTRGGVLGAGAPEHRSRPGNRRGRRTRRRRGPRSALHGQHAAKECSMNLPDIVGVDRRCRLRRRQPGRSACSTKVARSSGSTTSR